MPVAVMDGRYQFTFGPDTSISKLVHRYSGILEDNDLSNLSPPGTSVFPPGLDTKQIKPVLEFVEELQQKVWTYLHRREESRATPQDTIPKPGAFASFAKGLGRIVEVMDERDDTLASGESTYTELDITKEFFHKYIVSELQRNLERTQSALEDYKQNPDLSPLRTDKLNYSIQNIETLLNGGRDWILVFESPNGSITHDRRKESTYGVF